MKSYKIQGIVIKRRNSGEADRVISFFSKEKGKLRLIAKGIRRIKSKRAPHLEIFSYSKLVIEERNHYFYIKEAVIIDTFSNIRKNFQKINISFHLCEIIDKIVPENEINAEILDSLLQIFTMLNKENDMIVIRIKINIFVQNLLVNLGFINKQVKLNYNQMLNEIEKISEKPLNTLRILTKLKKDIQ